MSTYYAINSESISVLVLGGWSPGPLPYLKRSFQWRCTFLEPSIPMPPVGISWCLDCGMLVLTLVIAVAIWACIVLPDYFYSRVWLTVTRLSVVMATVFLARLCVAAVVRGSISKGIHIAETYMCRHKVAIVIGFSWGGAVVAEMLRLGLIGAPGQPAVLLIAPTTALVTAVAMRKDTPLTIRVADGLGHCVHVFHATGDEVFCPHRDRWELTGVMTHLCQDNHVFCRRESLNELSDVLSTILRNHA
jgi:hypothetical protein